MEKVRLRCFSRIHRTTAANVHNTLKQSTVGAPLTGIGDVGTFASIRFELMYTKIETITQNVLHNVLNGFVLNDCEMYLVYTNYLNSM